MSLIGLALVAFALIAFSNERDVVFPSLGTSRF